MDSSYQLSDTILGELMLDAAKLTKMERLLVLTSTQNKTDVDSIVKALHEEHPTLRREEKASIESERTGRPQPRRRSFHGKSSGHRKFKRHGYVADNQTHADTSSSEETVAELDNEYARNIGHEERSHRSQGAYAASSYDRRDEGETDPYPGPPYEREYTAVEWAEYELFGY